MRKWCNNIAKRQANTFYFQSCFNFSFNHFLELVSLSTPQFGRMIYKCSTYYIKINQGVCFGL